MHSPTIRELPEDDRPREKLEKLGAEALSIGELLAILLRTGVQGANAVEIGRRLMDRFGSLGGLGRCSVAELKGIHGVGLAKAVQLAAAFELGRRLAGESLARQPLDAPQLIWELLGGQMRLLRKESLRVVLLDTKLHLLHIEEISVGTINESIAHPREIFRPALIHAAYALIVVHNHPSGDPAPSAADHSLTRRLCEGAHLLQIRLLDHVILGNADNGRQPWFSFKEAGVL